MIGHIKCMYSCQGCGLKNEPIFVRPRQKNESIESYMREAIAVAAISHSILSRECTERKVDLALPITASGIGFEGRELTDEEKKSLDELLKPKDP